MITHNPHRTFKTAKRSFPIAEGHRSSSPLVDLRVADYRLMERVELVLQASGYSPLRSIAVSVRDGVVRLVGVVPSYYLKQIAQSRAMALPGVNRILNELEVTQPINQVF